jgi:hypothetical protein
MRQGAANSGTYQYLGAIALHAKRSKLLVAREGLEPPTPGLWFPCSNQLSYLATVRRHGFIYRRRERAAYKKPVKGLSSKAGRAVKALSSLWQISRYLGRIVGSPPGLPGGGITRMVPVSGAGARIWGSTPAGGHNTPSDCASLSANGAWAWPVVVPLGAILPCGVVCVGAQPVARSGAGGAVCAWGIAGAGGAWATAAPDIAISAHDRKSVGFIVMQGKRPAGVDVPVQETF